MNMKLVPISGASVVPCIPGTGPRIDDPALHVQRMLDSFRHFLKRELIDRTGSPEEQAERLFNASFVIASHGTEKIPIFNYGNQKALDLFEMTLGDFTNMESRKSAEPMNQEERERFLKQVTENGFIENYSGVRISSTGKRFKVENVAVWNLLDENGNRCGQAATFDKWIPIPKV